MEILINRLHNFQNYVSTEEPILNKRKEELKNLYSMPLIQKYVKEYNKINSLIRDPSYKTNQRIIEQILK